MKNALAELFEVVSQTYSDWIEDKVPRLGAALAFYTALSIAPLLVLSLRVAATVFGDDAARGEIKYQFEFMVGKEGSEAVEAMLQNANRPGSGMTATIVSFAILLFGASGVFGELHDSLNTIWEVQPKPGRGVWEFVRSRFISMTMVMGVVFLLLVSLVISAALSFTRSHMVGLASDSAWTGEVFNVLFSLIIFTGLFAMILKYLPDAKIAWKDVWIGAAITAVLFTLGKFATGIYIGRSAIASSYGVAGSLIVLLVWVYYSAQVVFLGAEFTQVYANRYGSRIIPSEYARTVPRISAATEGMAQRPN